eukprot:gb/GECG01012861.1/.p1 GENE.gb/GECG01012861.1/~~gb/GECG01012861.1/.p1  ORF type:complete len:1519 (+),score=193.80 gb/GECG01012861.1/:1-4557(+)
MLRDAAIAYADVSRRKQRGSLTTIGTGPGFFKDEPPIVDRRKSLTTTAKQDREKFFSAPLGPFEGNSEYADEEGDGDAQGVEADIWDSSTLTQSRDELSTELEDTSFAYPRRSPQSISGTFATSIRGESRDAEPDVTSTRYNDDTVNGQQNTKRNQGANEECQPKTSEGGLPQKERYTANWETNGDSAVTNAPVVYGSHTVSRKKVRKSGNPKRKEKDGREKPGRKMTRTMHNGKEPKQTSLSVTESSNAHKRAEAAHRRARGEGSNHQNSRDTAGVDDAHTRKQTKPHVTEPSGSIGGCYNPYQTPGLGFVREPVAESIEGENNNSVAWSDSLGTTVNEDADFRGQRTNPPVEGVKARCSPYDSPEDTDYANVEEQVRLNVEEEDSDSTIFSSSQRSHGTTGSEVGRGKVEPTNASAARPNEGIEGHYSEYESMKDATAGYAKEDTEVKIEGDGMKPAKYSGVVGREHRTWTNPRGTGPSEVSNDQYGSSAQGAVPGYGRKQAGAHLEAADDDSASCWNASNVEIGEDITGVDEESAQRSCNGDAHTDPSSTNPPVTGFHEATNPHYDAYDTTQGVDSAQATGLDETTNAHYYASKTTLGVDSAHMREPVEGNLEREDDGSLSYWNSPNVEIGEGEHLTETAINTCSQNERDRTEIPSQLGYQGDAHNQGEQLRPGSFGTRASSDEAVSKVLPNRFANTGDGHASQECLYPHPSIYQQLSADHPYEAIPTQNHAVGSLSGRMTKERDDNSQNCSRVLTDTTGARDYTQYLHQHGTEAVAEARCTSQNSTRVSTDTTGSRDGGTQYPQQNSTEAVAEARYSTPFYTTTIHHPVAYNKIESGRSECPQPCGDQSTESLDASAATVEAYATSKTNFRTSVSSNGSTQDAHQSTASESSELIERCESDLHMEHLPWQVSEENISMYRQQEIPGSEMRTRQYNTEVPCTDYTNTITHQVYQERPQQASRESSDLGGDRIFHASTARGPTQSRDRERPEDHAGLEQREAQGISSTHKGEPSLTSEENLLQTSPSLHCYSTVATTSGSRAALFSEVEDNDRLSPDASPRSFQHSLTGAIRPRRRGATNDTSSQATAGKNIANIVSLQAGTLTLSANKGMSENNRNNGYLTRNRKGITALKNVARRVQRNYLADMMDLPLPPTKAGENIDELFEKHAAIILSSRQYCSRRITLSEMKHMMLFNAGPLKLRLLSRPREFSERLLASHRREILLETRRYMGTAFSHYSTRCAVPQMSPRLPQRQTRAKWASGTSVPTFSDRRPVPPLDLSGITAPESPDKTQEEAPRGRQELKDDINQSPRTDPLLSPPLSRDQVEHPMLSDRWNLDQSTRTSRTNKTISCGESPSEGTRSAREGKEKKFESPTIKYYKKQTSKISRLIRTTRNKSEERAESITSRSEPAPQSPYQASSLRALDKLKRRAIYHSQKGTVSETTEDVAVQLMSVLAPAGSPRRPKKKPSGKRLVKNPKLRNASYMTVEKDTAPYYWVGGASSSQITVANSQTNVRVNE